MKKTISIAGSGLAVGAALLMCSTSAMAHGRVDWSVSIGVPAYYPAPVIYSPPPVVYVEPQPVYQYAPVVRYRPEPYYVYREPYWRGHGWREHEWREHHEHREHREHHHDRDD